MYMMDQQSKWEEYLHLAKFSYYNRHHTSIGMPPYQALYGRPYRTTLIWDRIEDKISIGPQLVKDIK